MMSKFPLALGLILLFGACSSPESATAEPVQSAPEANEAANDAFSTLVDEGPSIELLSVDAAVHLDTCLLYTSPSPRDATLSRMPSSA